MIDKINIYSNQCYIVGARMGAQHSHTGLVEDDLRLYIYIYLNMLKL